jgi:hypothetical protein
LLRHDFAKSESQCMGNFEMLWMKINPGWRVDDVRRDLFNQSPQRILQRAHAPFAFGKADPLVPIELHEACRIGSFAAPLKGHPNGVGDHP